MDTNSNRGSNGIRQSNVDNRGCRKVPRDSTVVARAFMRRMHILCSGGSERDWCHSKGLPTNLGQQRRRGEKGEAIAWAIFVIALMCAAIEGMNLLNF